MRLTLDDIAGQFNVATYARGMDYALRRKVLSITWDDDCLLGEVEGSGRNVYEQTIYLSRSARGGVRVKGTCTCPVDYNCKHVVAVLLASLDEASGTGIAPEPGLPAGAEDWLGEFALAFAAGSPAAPAGPVHRLGFLLVPDRRDGTVRLHLCKTRPHKDGGLASATIHNDLSGLLVMPPDWIRPEDEEPLRLVAALRNGNPYYGDNRLTGAIGARLLEMLCAQGRLLYAASASGLKRATITVVSAGPRRDAILDWQCMEDSELFQLGWRSPDGGCIGYVLPTEPVLYLEGGRLGRLVLPEPLAAMRPRQLLAIVAKAPRLAPAHVAEMSMRLAARGLDRAVPLPQALQTRQRGDILPLPCLLLESAYGPGLDGLFHHATVSFDYDGEMATAASPAQLRRRQGGVIELIERNPEAEEAAGGLLAAQGFVGKSPDPLQLASPAHWMAFVRHEVPRLRAMGWRIAMAPGFLYDFHDPEDWYAELDEEGEGVNAWFALELGFIIDGQRHALLPLLVQMIRETPGHFDAASLAARDDGAEFIVTLPDGRRVALPWGRLKPILLTLGELYFTERLGDTLRLPATDAARLAELERAAQLRWMGGERLRELGRKLEGFGGVLPVAVPAGLHATLRGYQREGLAWMQFLREYGFGGILADDMGLGKTIQTLAHVLTEQEAGRLDAPALVVAPTSLMDNWQAEAARFAPGLRVLRLHGKDRAALFDGVGRADLVLTTYALLGRDEEALRRHRFHLLILDEAQYIKNSRSRAAQVACLLDARHRLCLTGTPVQNHLGELWSQFHFLMPGLLGDGKAFNAVFRKPIEQGGDQLRKDLLARRIKPFMLRRTKDKVATELPPKTEIMLPVELGGAQRDLYETVRVAMDRKVRYEIDRKGLARSQIVILDALLKLRQACCDPRLLKKSAATAGSAKLDALLELLDTLLSEGRKVLVFSQFTSMLALIADALRARTVDFAVLTGETENRAGAVAAFQHGSAAVFLISLKAGGVGLNLTAADTVIHYDPWWNPASENQATDRAWRIGQEQPVFVYKLIARGTVEEKIQDMQRRKGELASALLDAEGGLAPALDAEDLQAIFALPGESMNGPG